MANKTTTTTKTTSSTSTEQKRAPVAKRTKKDQEPVDSQPSNSPQERKERRRREVTKDSVDADFTSLQKRIDEEISRLRESSEKTRGIKFLRSVNKALKILHSDTKRVLKLKKKNNRKKSTISGFLKPIRISPELATFTGWDVNKNYSRVTVTKFICDYVKTNSLNNPKDKRQIV